MDKKVLFSLLTLAIFLGSVQIAEPVAAGTLFDQGKWVDYVDDNDYLHEFLDDHQNDHDSNWYSNHDYDPDRDHDDIYKITTYYKAYYGNGRIYVKASSFRSGKNVLAWRVTMRKTSSNQLKYYSKRWARGYGNDIESGYETYSGTATSFYWNKLKPGMKSIYTDLD